MNKKSQKADKEIEDRLGADLQKMMIDDVKRRGLDVDKFFGIKTKTDKQLLNNAFSQLRKHGYFAEQNFACCQSCGLSAVPDKNADKYVFYHDQDNDSIENGRIDKNGMCIAWAGDAKQIAEIISQTGLKAYWNGKRGTRILVLSQNTTPKQYNRITASMK